MTGNDTGGRGYGGWQREKVAFIFGLSGRRAALLAAAVLPVATARLAGGLVCWPVAAILGSAVYLRIAGRTADEWLAAFVSYQVLAFRGQHTFAAGPFTPRGGDDQPRMELPGILAPLRILSVPAGPGRDLAIAFHRYDRTYTAVALVRFPGIGLSDSSRREQRVAGWGALLAGLCSETNPLARIQVLQRLVPESGVALRSWHEAHLQPGTPELARQVTGELMATSTLATSRREAYLAVTMDEHHARAAIKTAGGGETGAALVLIRHLHALGQAIGGADLEIEEWLSTRDLAEVICTAYDPHVQLPLAARRPPRGVRIRRGPRR